MDALKPKIYLVLTVGIPGSGKSTLCSSMQSELLQKGHECYLLEFDLVEENIQKQKQAEGFDAEIWKQAREEIHLQVQEILSQQCTSGDIYVLLDDNFYYKSMRKPYYKLAAEFNKVNSERVSVFCEIHLQVILRFS